MSIKQEVERIKKTVLEKARMDAEKETFNGIPSDEVIPGILAILRENLDETQYDRVMGKIKEHLERVRTKTHITLDQLMDEVNDNGN